MKQARDYLTALYRDYRNNFLTVEKFAEHNGLTAAHATELLTIAEKVFDSDHPES